METGHLAQRLKGWAESYKPKASGCYSPKRAAKGELGGAWQGWAEGWASEEFKAAYESYEASRKQRTNVSALG